MLFRGSSIGAILCLLAAIYYALPGTYHLSLSHSHPPLNPKLDYMAAFLEPAVTFAGVTVLARRVARIEEPNPCQPPAQWGSRSPPQRPHGFSEYSGPNPILL